jgi:hypothetical protein
MTLRHIVCRNDLTARLHPPPTPPPNPINEQPTRRDQAAAPARGNDSSIGCSWTRRAALLNLDF